MSTSRTLVVGWDAACWEYLDPLLKAERLPNLARLIGQGVHGSLRSTMPPITPTAWSSLITGVNPGKHGIFEWVQRQPTSYQSTPISADHRVGTPVWARLNDAGIRVGVTNVPLTYPVQPLDGFMLCGFSTPASARDLTHPHELLAEIEARFGPYHPLAPIDPNECTPQEFYDASRTHQKQVVKIATTLSKEHDVQVLILNLMLLDHANHGMPTMDLVEQAIVDTDTDLGQLLAEYSPDNVMLLSDHGSRRVKGVFLLIAWLAEHDLLTRQMRPPHERSKVINFLLEQWLDGNPNALAPVGRRLLRESLSRLPALLTSPLHNAIERDIPLAFMQADTIDHFVPHSTQVYPAGGNRGNLTLNLIGREPEGIVSTASSEKILAQLSDDLRAIQEPDTGNPLFSRLYRPEELYTGPFAGDAPDLIGDYYQSDWSVVTTVPGLRRRPWRFFLTGERWHGDHSRDGIYVFAGRDFCHRSERSQANLLDIPATLLYLCDVPQPDDYDGHALRHAFQNADRPLRYQPGDQRSKRGTSSSYTEDEEREVLQRLSHLGYVDG